MVSRVLKVCPLFMLPILWASAPVYAGGANLTGSWDCQGQDGAAQLEFKSQNQLLFMGEAVNYTLTEGSIRVEQDYGTVDYPYTLKGNTLSVSFPDGSRLQCGRSEKKNRQDRAEASGGEHLLRGTFCHWSGSTAYSSSYSRSTRATFDGQGRFHYGSETAMNAKEGIAYAANPSTSGRYKVKGDSVYLTFGDGTAAAIKINNRAGDGSITELMYGKDLYAPGLCD